MVSSEIRKQTWIIASSSEVVKVLPRAPFLFGVVGESGGGVPSVTVSVAGGATVGLAA